MVRKTLSLISLLIFFILISTINAGADSAVDSNLNISIPCINVSGTYYQIDLLKYNNLADPNGHYWKLGPNLLTVSDDGSCATIDGNLLITLPGVDVQGTVYTVTLPYYANSQDQNGHYWKLGFAAPKTSASFSLSSQNFSSGGMIPLDHVCANEGGSNISPQLSWANIPQGTGSFALIMDDEDSPCGTGDNACRHWAVFNIPDSVNSFQTNQDISLISGLTLGANYKGMIGYAGPCPPNQHTYNFTIYALGSGMPLISSGGIMTRSIFENSYSSYILDSATLQGVFNP